MGIKTETEHRKRMETLRPKLFFGGKKIEKLSEKELDNPETKNYMVKYLAAAAPADKRMRIARFLQNWVAGLHGIGTYQGSGHQG